MRRCPALRPGQTVHHNAASTAAGAHHTLFGMRLAPTQTFAPAELAGVHAMSVLLFVAVCTVGSVSCSYSHGLRDCWQPRNAAAVTAARAEFTAASGSGTIAGMKLPSRYMLCVDAKPALQQHHTAATHLAVCPWPVIYCITLSARGNPLLDSLHSGFNTAHRYFTSMDGAADTSERGDGTSRPAADGEPAPGQLSAELRAALGISPLAPPPWLARMRRLGYPPGYIAPDAEAVVDAGNDVFGADDIVSCVCRRALSSSWCIVSDQL